MVPSSEKMFYKSSLFLLRELVEARVVSGSAAKGKDFLESIVSSFLTFGAFAQKFFGSSYRMRDIYAHDVF